MRNQHVLDSGSASFQVLLDSGSTISTSFPGTVDDFEVQFAFHFENISCNGHSSGGGIIPDGSATFNFDNGL